MRPIALHPENPHYFLWRGQPTVLVTSAEHYGAVLNADFDYRAYLDCLARDGLNHTRIFTGAYCEPTGAFRISGNTLAPAPGRLLCPWARSAEPGYANGGNRFDLGRWDSAYFERLQDFVAIAGEAGVVVEVNLFCPFYRDEMWDLSPMKASNNINGDEQVSKDDVYSLDRSGDLLAVQESMTRKVVAELRGCDNLFYEIMNEPYQKDVPMAWQERIIDVVAAAEEDGDEPHLISLNVANHKERMQDPHPAVSLFNFHYAWPPDTVGLNYDLGKPIGDNETGFVGQLDFTYRREAWAFLMAGGALYNHLDYTFAVGHEDGSFDYPETQPGGGSVQLRRQLGILARFVQGFEFVRMAPIPGDCVTTAAEGVSTFGLREGGSQYAVYLCQEEDAGAAQSVQLQLDLPTGRYDLQWLDTKTGEQTSIEKLTHAGGVVALASPPFGEDVALCIVAST